MIKKIKNIHKNSLIKQWDTLGPIRDHQLRARIDTSFDNILSPFILNKIKEADTFNVLDFGCGTGVLTEILAEKSFNVTGVDISPVSIGIATRSPTRRENIEYRLDTEINFFDREEFTCVVANMVMQDVIDLDQCLSDIYKSCKARAMLIITITHPWFWPMYWNYYKEPWFDYNKEIAIEAPFKITNDQTNEITSIHFHRPLHTYTTSLSKNGFTINSIHELSSQNTNNNTSWTYPKFIAIVGQKT